MRVNRWLWVYTIMVFAFFFIVGTLLSDEAHGDVETAPVVEGCVIRLYSTGPEVHENATHDCRGVAAVSKDGAGDLLIVHSVQGAVVTMVAAPDEALAQRQVVCGPSGGPVFTIVKCYKNGQHVSIMSSAVASPYANIWFGRTVIPNR